MHYRAEEAKYLLRKIGFSFEAIGTGNATFYFYKEQTIPTRVRERQEHKTE
jgi:hypothetical protein